MVHIAQNSHPVCKDMWDLKGKRERASTDLKWVSWGVNDSKVWAWGVRREFEQWWYTQEPWDSRSGLEVRSKGKAIPRQDARLWYLKGSIETRVTKDARTSAWRWRYPAWPVWDTGWTWANYTCISGHHHAHLVLQPVGSKVSPLHMSGQGIRHLPLENLCLCSQFGVAPGWGVCKNTTRMLRKVEIPLREAGFHTWAWELDVRIAWCDFNIASPIKHQIEQPSFDKSKIYHFTF